VPTPVGLGVEAPHQGPSHVVRQVGVAVEVDDQIVPLGAGQCEHGAVPQRTGHQKGKQEHQGHRQRPDLPEYREWPVAREEPPCQVQYRQAGQKPFQPAHAQHRDRIP
jgi:hypothetical protein